MMSPGTDCSPGASDVRCADHRIAVPEMPDRSVDVVLFDPMFRNPARIRVATEGRAESAQAVQGGAVTGVGPAAVAAGGEEENERG